MSAPAVGRSAIEDQLASIDPKEARPLRTGRSTWVNPKLLAYLMGPISLIVILLLVQFGIAAHESPWLWLGVFIAVPIVNLEVDHLCGGRKSRLHLNIRIAVQASSLTLVIYLTGWGPVLWGAYAFLALENVAHGGSRIWRLTALWSVVGIACGQVAVWLHWMPSMMSTGQGNSLALMGTFVLLFIIRMAAATMEQKERADASMQMVEDRYRSLIQNSSDTTMEMDGDGICTYVSPAIVELLDFEPDDLIGQSATAFVHPDDRDRVRGRLGAHFQSSAQTASLQFRMLRKDGTWREVEAVVANQLDRPSIEGYVANIRDITERKEFEALLAHRALHDPLTGLANRQLVLDRAEQMLARTRRTFDPVAAYFIDLDNFKDTNDSLGHEAGDKLLRAVADRLVGMLRASDTVGRLGGDEFVILAEGASLSRGPEAIAERVRQVLREPFLIDPYSEVPITVTPSVGIASGDRPSAQELLRDADIALYRAKAAGRDCAVLFEPAMQAAAVDRLKLKTDLDSALSQHQFFILYQPIFELESIRMRGVEALLRWNHPTRGVISPDDFIPMLEDSGMIVDVGRWVLLEACRQASLWKARGYETTMSVNVAMRQLEADSFVEHVREALDATGLAPGSLIIEVTESTLMRDADATVSRLEKLKELGVMIAIDDFGTGYSSLAYLRQFPVDILKIDRSFVADMDGRPDAAALIHTLVELGRALGLSTLAEGIEDMSQLESLRIEQCDSGQGFIFSKPVPPGEIEERLADMDDHTFPVDRPVGRPSPPSRSSPASTVASP
ncbi:MAG: putative bifunctional diguanylate cyclase/phosphodiesterase [Acidimicrobiales bacterium]